MKHVLEEGKLLKCFRHDLRESKKTKKTEF